jgi:hypothetical protein
MLAIFAIAGLVFVAVSFATWSRPSVLGLTGPTGDWQTARGVLFGFVDPRTARLLAVGMVFSTASRQHPDLCLSAQGLERCLDFGRGRTWSAVWREEIKRQSAPTAGRRSRGELPG